MQDPEFFIPLISSIQFFKQIGKQIGFVYVPHRVFYLGTLLAGCV